MEAKFLRAKPETWKKGLIAIPIIKECSHPTKAENLPCILISVFGVTFFQLCYKDIWSGRAAIKEHQTLL